jgi:lysophospholipase L1-like esterase
MGNVGDMLGWEQAVQRNCKHPRFGKRYFLFRAAAILLGLLPFLLCELVLYGVGWQPPDGVRDPYVGFTELRPLFEKNEASGQYQISKSRYPLFCPDSFPITKAENEVRIFCVGGSTVQGRPFALETAFSTWLELSLQVADPSRKWTVVNCGGVSYASYRLAPIVEEIMDYQPDVLILYTGHNEFLEDRTYASIKATSPLILRSHERLSSLKTYSFLRSCVVGGRDKDAVENAASEMPTEVEARLDFRGGLAKYTRDDLWKQNVVRHFEYNLRRMVKTAKSNGVPMIICKPVANLRDSAPFKSQNGELATADLQTFQKSWQSIPIDDLSLNSIQIRERLESLVKLDPHHAESHYLLGQAYLETGDFKKAKQHLILAKEEDICPLRILEPMYDVIENVSREFDVSLIDSKAFFEMRAKDGIPGRESLIDHVHPTIHGHQLIAGLLMDELVARNWVKISNDFADARNAQFETHLESLPYLYFELGKDRLAGLKRWSEGRVTREKESQED